MQKVEHLHIKISEFGFRNPEGFTPIELKNGLDFSKGEMTVLDKYFNIAHSLDTNIVLNSSDTIFTVLVKVSNTEDHINKSTYILKPEFFFSYIGYLEFQHAQKMSKLAVKSANDATILAQQSIFYAKWALILSIIFSVGGIVVQIWSTYQPTQIDLNQFNEIKNIVSSEVRK